MSQVLPSDSDGRALAPFSFGHGDGLELQYPDRLITPSAWIGHTPFALWLVGALKPRVLVELGVHAGNSYCAFLQGVQARKLDTRCFGIDHWRGDPHAGLYTEEIYEELRAYHDPRYGSFSTLLRYSFDEALPYFSDGSIDLLHIDGFHTYEAAAHDLESWLPRMSARGVVLLHDTNVREKGFGIWRLWEEIALRYPTFELPHSHGLGVVYVGREPLPDALEFLLAPGTEADLDGVREYFARLGASVVDRFSLGELTSKVDALGKERHELRSELDRTATGAAELNLAHEKAAAHAQTLAAKLREAERHTSALEKERHELRSELDRTATGAAELNLAHEKAAAHAQTLAAKLREAVERTATLTNDYEARLRAATVRAELHTSLLRQRVLITARLQRELLAAHQELRSTHQELRSMTEQLAKETDEKLERDRTIREIFETRSWRMTAPIRFAAALLRRALGRSA